MKLLVVIVCYKVVDLTIDCLRSLDAEIRGIAGAHVIVCENGTGGDSPARLERAIHENGWGDWCELQAIYPNLGFTGGNNHVIRGAMAREDSPQYVLLLNADTIIPPGAIKTLVDFMDEHPQAGIAGSALLNADQTPGPSPYRFQGILSEFDRGLRLGIVSYILRRWAVNPPAPIKPARADWVSGACLMIRREVIEKIGVLDEDFYTYFDDIDYCLSAKKAGFSSWYVPASKIIHLEGMSTGIKMKAPVPKRRPGYWFDARRHFFLKHYGAFYTALVDLAFITGFALWRMRRWVQRKPDNDPPHMLMDSIRHSVFFKGFKLTAVENPALKQGVAPAGALAAK